MGGYDYYEQWKDALADTYADDAYLLGVPDYDYAEEAASTVQETADEGQPKAKVSVKRNLLVAR